jgi:hypothetical protein
MDFARVKIAPTTVESENNGQTTFEGTNSLPLYYIIPQLTMSNSPTDHNPANYE